MTKLLINLFIKNKEDVSNPDVRNRYAMLSNATGIAANTLLCAVKLLAGLLSGSVAMVADALNNLSDAGSNIVGMIGFRLASRHADEKHPHGHGRFEYLTALVVDVMIILVGVGLFQNSFDKIRNPDLPEVSTITLVLLVLAVLVKLWMFFFYRKIGEIIHSSVVKATALDSLSDVAATSLVFLSALGAKFWELQLDGWAGILVSAFIIFTGFKAAKETVDLMLGTAPEQELVNEISAFAKQYPQILGIHDLMVHDYGPTRLVVSLHVEFPEDYTLCQAHAVVDQMERDMQKQFGCLATIHPDPVAVDDAYVDSLRHLAEECAAEVDTSYIIHDFRIIGSGDSVKVFFDLYIPMNAKIDEAEAAALVAKQIQMKNPCCQVIITPEHPFV